MSPEKHGILTQSPLMDEVTRLIEQYSRFEESVLITGETGTGKELVAKAIHDEGPRRDKPFIPVNCAAIPEALLESELFGHTKGAFTGAYQKRQGKFQAADGGSIFLDEIGHMPKHQQPKLLRVLESNEVVPVGSDKNENVDVRIILATSNDLEKAVESKKIDESLYYRIIVPQIPLPPLRERDGDIRLLSNYFLDEINTKYDKDFEFDSETLDYLGSFEWPGNIRQLKRTIYAAAASSGNGVIKKGTLKGVVDMKQYRPMALREHYKKTICGMLRSGYGVAQIENTAVECAMELSGGNKTEAAEMLGITRATLYAKLE